MEDSYIWLYIVIISGAEGLDKQAGNEDPMSHNP